MHILFLGASFTGRYLAFQVGTRSRSRAEEQVGGDSRVRTAFASVDRVSFLSRTPLALSQHGLHPHDQADDRTVDLIVDTVPALSPEGPAYSRDIARILGHGRAALIHVSSTSVYPTVLDDGRGAVDESTPLDPAGSGSERVSLEAAIARAFPSVMILRSAGLYGPGRALPLSFMRGDFKRASAGNRIVSRIHVADLLRLAIALGAQRSVNVLNGVDALPSENRVVFSFLEELLGVVVPGAWRFEEPRGRAVHSRNALRLIGEYLFPSFREGFVDVVNHARRDGLP